MGPIIKILNAEPYIHLIYCFHFVRSIVSKLFKFFPEFFLHSRSFASSKIPFLKNSLIINVKKVKIQIKNLQNCTNIQIQLIFYIFYFASQKEQLLQKLSFELYTVHPVWFWNLLKSLCVCIIKICQIFWNN